jgi:hypothetical protein
MPWIHMRYISNKSFGKEERLRTFVANQEQLNEKLERYEVAKITEMIVDDKESSLEAVFSD